MNRGLSTIWRRIREDPRVQNRVQTEQSNLKFQDISKSKSTEVDEKDSVHDKGKKYNK